MKTLIAIVVALCCSVGSAQDYWRSPQRNYSPLQCRTEWVPVANYYRVERDPWSGQVYGREYLGTRYEQRTYCSPHAGYGFEPWIQPIRQPHILSDEQRWNLDSGYGQYR